MTTSEASNGPGDSGSGYAHGLLVAVMLLTVPLVGCADDGGGGGVGVTGDSMTAREGLDAADARAEQWADDPTLVGAFTAEWKQSPPEDVPQDEIDWKADGDITDGLSHVWGYAYKDGSGNSMAVLVNTDGNVALNDTEGSDFQEAVEDWEISSSEAVDTARENQTFETILGADDAEILILLLQGQEGPAWWITAKSESMDQEQPVIVNAISGERSTFG